MTVVMANELADVFFLLERAAASAALLDLSVESQEAIEAAKVALIREAKRCVELS